MHVVKEFSGEGEEGVGEGGTQQIETHICMQEEGEEAGRRDWRDDFQVGGARKGGFSRDSQDESGVFQQGSTFKNFFQGAGTAHHAVKDYHGSFQFLPYSLLSSFQGAFCEGEAF